MLHFDISSHISRLEKEKVGGEALASKVGTDTPAFAADYFSGAELRTISSLFAASSSTHSDQWTDIPLGFARANASIASERGDIAPLLQKLINGLERVHRERTMPDVQALADGLFGEDRRTERFIPLDDAMSRVEGFLDGARCAYLRALASDLMGDLVNSPAKYIAGTAPQTNSAEGLAQALWGNESPLQVRDQVELVSKLAHLKRFVDYCGGFSVGQLDALFVPYRDLRVALLREVAYLDVKDISEAKGLGKVVRLPELVEYAAEPNMFEQRERLRAILATFPQASVGAVRSALSKFDRVLNVEAKDVQLKSLGLRIERGVIDEIERIALMPTRDLAFRRALRQPMFTKATPDRFEVGAHLFGERRKDGALHVQKVVPYSSVWLGTISGWPAIQFDVERERQRIKKVEAKGYSYLGDWHLHPEGTLSTPSLRGDPRLYRKFRGDSYKEGETAVQLIVKADRTSGQVKVFPYVYYTFAADREVRVPQETARVWSRTQEIEALPALVREKKPHIVGQSSSFKSLRAVADRILDRWRS